MPLVPGVSISSFIFQISVFVNRSSIVLSVSRSKNLMKMYHTAAVCLIYASVVLGNSILTTKFSPPRDAAALLQLNLTCEAIAIQEDIRDHDIQCGRLCQKHIDGCLGFSYDENTQSCRVCRSLGAGSPSESSVPPNVAFVRGKYWLRRMIDSNKKTFC